MAKVSTGIANHYVSTAAELQSALTEAQNNALDDVIHIAQGTYLGGFIYVSTESNDLSILGGYSSDFSVREVDSSNTVLDGGASSGVIVIMTPLAACDFSIDGLTMQNGLTSATELYGKGGGIRVESGGQINITNNNFTNNSSYDGSGAYIEGNVTFSNNIFSSNTAIHTGTITINSGNATLVNNVITSNSANYIGGIDVDTNSLFNTVIENNVISSNSGDGIYTGSSSVEITNNTVSYNGGGIYTRGGGTISNNLISDNSSSSTGGGRGIQADGGVYIVTGNTIVNNNSGIIVHLFDDEQSVTITNNLFYGNDNTDRYGVDYFSDIYIGNDSNDNYIPSTVVLTNNNFNQSSDGTYIKLPFTIDASNLNNIDPLFVDAANGDYRLSSDSPLIDQGVVTANVASTDLDGNTRTVGSAVDIGAYEYQSVVMPRTLIIGTIGDDTLIINSDTTSVQAGAGIDNAVFSGNYADYTFSQSGSFVPLMTHSTTGQVVSLFGVEQLKFDDKWLDMLISPNSGEFEISTNNSIPTYFSSGGVSLGDNGFVVLWTSGEGLWVNVLAQLYDINGNKIGNQFQANTSSYSETAYPEATALDNGGFVVTWSAYGGTSPTNIFAQQFDESGNQVGVEFQVNTYPYRSYDANASLTPLSDGGFIATWNSLGRNDDSSGIYAQRFDESGNQAGVEFQVNSSINGEQKNPVVVVLTDGNFVITWQSGSGNDDIFAQIFNESGNQVGVEFQINTYTNGGQNYPNITAMLDGGFVATWQSVGVDGDEIFAQRFDESGNYIGSECLLLRVWIRPLFHLFNVFKYLCSHPKTSLSTNYAGSIYGD